MTNKKIRSTEDLGINNLGKGINKDKILEAQKNVESLPVRILQVKKISLRWRHQ